MSKLHTAQSSTNNQSKLRLSSKEPSSLTHDNLARFLYSGKRVTLNQLLSFFKA